MMRTNQRPAPAFDMKDVVHAVLTLVILIIGMVLLLPGDLFPRSSSWALMAEAFPENTWGMIFVFIGFLGAAGIAPAYRWVRLATTVMLSTAHGALASAFFLSNPFGSIADIPLFGLATLGYYLLWREGMWDRS